MTASRCYCCRSAAIINIVIRRFFLCEHKKVAFANIHKQKSKHVNTHTTVRTHCARETHRIQRCRFTQPCYRYHFIVSLYLFIIFINIQWIESEREDEARKSQFILSAIQSSSSISHNCGIPKHWWWGGMRSKRKYFMARQEWKKETNEARLWTNYFYNIRNNFLFKSRGYRTTIFIRLMDDSFVHIFSICSLLIDNDSACVLMIV